jgi:hypothetical protein
VDERVGRSQPVGHLLGESLHLHARLVREFLLEPPTELLVPPAQTDDQTDIG